MNNVVKLILTCQVKDDKIPQLIPLIWVFSIIIWLILLGVLVDLYYNLDYSIIKLRKERVQMLNFQW